MDSNDQQQSIVDSIDVVAMEAIVSSQEISQEVKLDKNITESMKSSSTFVDDPIESFKKFIDEGERLSIYLFYLKFYLFIDRCHGP